MSLLLSLSLSLSPSDNCKKCALVYDDVISSCEIINCQSTQVQVRYNRVKPLKQDPLNKEHLSYYRTIGSPYNYANTLLYYL